MKTCTKCGAEKPLEDFPKNKSLKDGHHNSCRPCFNTYEAQARERIREYIRKAKTSCESCGESHPATLQFHHRNPEEKMIGIAQIQAHRWSLKRIQKELDKCRVLCANCHAKIHWKDNLFIRIA